MNPTLKRLEEIEAVCHEDAHLVGWLCARLRDALEVIEALHIKECRRDLLPLSGYPFIHASNDPKWTFGTCGDEAVVAAYRRLFGEEEVGEMLPAKLPLGHPYSTFVDGDDGRPCQAFLGHGRVCGQPRSAHEPPTKPTL